MKNIYKLFQAFGFIVSISSLFFASPVRSDTTYVSGPIVSSNWTLAGSPYVVTDNISITGLIIDPGVSVLFAGNYEFLVSGVIEAVGTEQSQIIFTTKTGVASWKGIRFQNSSSLSFMKWCIVEKANNSGIRIIESVPPRLFKCSIRNNQAVRYGGGLYLSNSIVTDTLKVEDCTFENNLATLATNTFNDFGGGGGVSIISGTADFYRCSFLYNSVLTITGANIVFIALGGGISTWGNTSIRNCKISNNNVTASTSNGSADAHAYGGGMYAGDGITNIQNSIIDYDSVITSGGDNPNPRGGGFMTNGGQTTIVNSTIVHNNRQGLWRDNGTVSVINSIVYFNNNNGQQIAGTNTVTYSCVQGGYTGTGNISGNPNLDPVCLKILTGSPCIDAGKDSIIYRDACFPPSLGNLRNDMGAYGGPGACNWLYFQDTTICTPWPVLSINIELTALMQGLYNPVTNMMARPQSEILCLRNATCPYAIVEPAAATLSQIGISSPEFIFNSAPSGTYYLVTKNWNSLETWSKTGGEVLYNDGETNYYDFTTASSQAYGNNLIQIDDSPLRYGIYIGDVSQFGAIDLADVLQIYTSSNLFTTGYNVNDLNGDNQVNLTDVLIAYNNSAAFVSVKKPICPP